MFSLPLSPGLVDRAWTVLGYSGIWTVVFIIISIARHKGSVDTNNRLVSVLHNFVALYLCVQNFDLRDFYDNYGGHNKPWQTDLLTISCSYFLYDTFSTIYSDLKTAGKIDWAMFAHHVVTLMGCYIGVFEERCGPELTACLLVTEVSGPFMHLRQILKNAGEPLKSSTLAKVNEAVFVALFLVARVVLSPKIVWLTVVSPLTHPFVKFGGVGLLIVSLIWAFAMVKMIARKLVFGLGRKPKTT